MGDREVRMGGRVGEVVGSQEFARTMVRRKIGNGRWSFAGREFGNGEVERKTNLWKKEIRRTWNLQEERLRESD